MIRFVKFFLYFILPVSFMACAPPQGFEAKNYSQEEIITQIDLSRRKTRESTGYEVWLPKKADPTKYQQIKYTPSGNLDSYEKLAIQERESLFHSTDFSQKIQTAYITQTLKEKVRSFKIEISLKGLEENLQFNYEIPEDKTLEAINTKASNALTEGVSYNLISQCENLECRVIKITLQEMKEDKIQSQASLLYTVSTTKMKTQVASKEGELEGEQNPLVEKLKGQTDVVKETITVVDGIAKSKVTVPDPENPNQSLLTVETPVGETFQDALDASKVVLGDQKKTEGAEAPIKLEAQLQGSNPETGNIVVDVKIPGKEAKDDSKVRLVIKEEAPTQPPAIIEPKPKHELEELYKNSIFPLTTDNLSAAQLPTTFATISRLERYRNHKELQKYISMWVDNNSSKVGACKSKTYYTPQRAKNFLTQMSIKIPQTGKTLGELTSGILNKVDSLPQTAYLAALEGNYWKDFNANIIAPYNPRAGQANIRNRYQYWSDAAGPYGCLTDTCKQIINSNKSLLERAGLNLNVYYVTPMERDMYRRAAVENKVECVNSRGEKVIKCLNRGDIRRTIFKTGLEDKYKTERKSHSLIDKDARKYFATSTLLAGLEVRRLLYEKKAVEKDSTSSKSKHSFEWQLREDPALAILSYRSGEGTVAKSSVCSQLSTEKERQDCKRTMSISNAVQVRHEGFHTTFDEISDLGMTNCEYIDYTWAWLALQFVGSNPEKFGIELGTPTNQQALLQSLMPEGLNLAWMAQVSEGPRGQNPRNL